MIAQAVEAELNTFLAAHSDQTDAAGRRRLVRHGHLPERDIQTGIGGVAVTPTSSRPSRTNPNGNNRAVILIAVRAWEDPCIILTQRHHYRRYEWTGRAVLCETRSQAK